MTTVALVAAKDAAESIAATVDALGALRGVDEVWVVDDGSADNTAAVARAAGARVVRIEPNCGKGGAVAAGVAATPHASQYLLADADLGATAAGLQPLLNAQQPFVVAVLPGADGRGGFGFVKRIAAAGIRRATGVTLRAPISGQRLVDGGALRSLVLAPRFGVEVGMTIDLLRAGVGVAEIPVAVEHHHRGRSIGGFAHRARQGVDVLGALVSRLVSERQRIIAIVALAVLTFGALSAVSAARRPPTSAALPHAERVVLFAYDGLALDDLRNAAHPNLRALERRAAAGALSVRTTDRRRLDNRATAERPSLAEAYASLGASARVRWSGSMQASRIQARRDRADSQPGALGDALRNAGKATAVITSRPRTTATAALADRRGRLGTVVRGTGAVGDEVVAALRVASVVLVEPAPAAADAQLADVVAAVAPGTLLVVFSPTPPTAEWELTPVLVAHQGLVVPASIASATTRRASLGGLVDLAPTVLQALRADVPAAMTGAPLRVADGAPDLAGLRRLQLDGAARSRFFLPASVGYSAVGIAFYLALMAALCAGVRGASRRVLRVGVCALAAFPLAALVIGGTQHWLRAGGESPVLLVGVALGLGGLASRWRGVGPAVVLAALVLGVIALDVAATGPIHAASILGYSIQTTGRYYGLPNASFAVFASSLFLVAGGLAAGTPTRPQAAAASAVLAVGAAFVAAPWLGNDVGGTLTLVPISLAAAWAWFGRTFNVRVFAGGIALAALLFLALTLAQAAAGDTHLGRAVGGEGSVLNTLLRRFEANLGLLVDQWWGFLSLALAVAALALLRQPPRFADYLPPRAGLRVATLSILSASLLGFIVNDSGPVVNVLCLAVVAPALALSALAGRRRVIPLAG